MVEIDEEIGCGNPSSMGTRNGLQKDSLLRVDKGVGNRRNIRTSVDLERRHSDHPEEQNVSRGILAEGSGLPKIRENGKGIRSMVSCNAFQEILQLKTRC